MNKNFSTQNLKYIIQKYDLENDIPNIQQFKTRLLTLNCILNQLYLITNQKNTQKEKIKQIQNIQCSHIKFTQKQAKTLLQKYEHSIAMLNHSYQHPKINTSSFENIPNNLSIKKQKDPLPIITPYSNHDLNNKANQQTGGGILDKIIPLRILERKFGMWVSIPLDIISIILDVASIAIELTGVGVVVAWLPDLINALLSFARGDYIDMLMGVIGMIPGIGNIANISKIVFKAIKYLLKALGFGKKASKAVKYAAKGYGAAASGYGAMQAARAWYPQQAQQQLQPRPYPYPPQQYALQYAQQQQHQIGGNNMPKYQNNNLILALQNAKKAISIIDNENISKHLQEIWQEIMGDYKKYKKTGEQKYIQKINNNISRIYFATSLAPFTCKMNN